MANELTAMRLDTEPPILFGCTSSEVNLIVTLSIIVWLFMAIFLFGLILGYWIIALPLGAVGAVATILISAKRIGRIKRDKPDGYLVHRFEIRSREYLGAFLPRLPYVRHIGFWDLGRPL